MLEERLQKEFDNALWVCNGTHATGINRDYLSVFKRVARVKPEAISQVIDIYTSCIRAHRSNLVASLYGIMQLADISPKMKSIVSERFPEVEISHLEKDEDSSVSGNARILREVLNGSSLENFQKKEEPATPYVNISNSTIGILSQGKDANIVGNTFENVTGVKSTGEKAQISNNSFRTTTSATENLTWVGKMFWFFFVPLLVAVFAGFILHYLGWV